ncbi:MAG: hypothetical protein QNL04_08690 [SAR324 cluster bacterium]|nr:hypothetical protein [SAR324 cluster bacterium]
MYNAISIPADSVMLFNTVKLKPGVTLDDVELLIGEMCNVVKETYGTEEGGFIAGQVMRYSGFVSKEGSVNSGGTQAEHFAIVTYWNSYEQHEASHRDAIFLEKFNAVVDLCSEATEMGYEMLWQGQPEVVEDAHH